MIQCPDLNKLAIETDGNQTVSVSDPACSSLSAGVHVYFRRLEDHLSAHIRRADLVVGCVAWLTNRRVIADLSRVPQGAAIVVQKEDFLRPDIDGDGRGWKADLRRLYGTLKGLPPRPCWGGMVAELSTHDQPGIDPIRCVGNHNRSKHPAFPRMHHKFLVFCRTAKVTGYSESEGWSHLDVVPYEVWTGSFNLTANASRSLENAVVIRDEQVARSFYREWEQIEALSEPLDWTSDWCAPEWRIGS